MPIRKRAKVLAFIVASVLSILSTAITLASDGQVPFPK